VARTTTSMRARMPIVARMQTRWTVQVWVTRKGTLVRRIGRNSERIAVRETVARIGSRRERERGKAEKGVSGGARRIVEGGWGDLERRLYGVNIAIPEMNAGVSRLSL